MRNLLGISNCAYVYKNYDEKIYKMNNYAESNENI